MHQRVVDVVVGLRVQAFLIFCCSQHFLLSELSLGLNTELNQSFLCLSPGLNTGVLQQASCVAPSKFPFRVCFSVVPRQVPAAPTDFSHFSHFGRSSTFTIIITVSSHIFLH